MAKKKKYLKYFELSIEGVGDWNWQNYIIFLIESLYQTIFPFIAGMLLVARKELVWVFMLILPIYFKFKIDKKDNYSRKKKIFVKE